MMGLALIEILLVLFFGAVLVTQFVVPFIRGTSFLPIIRRKARELERELAEAKQEAREADLQAEIASVKARTTDAEVREQIARGVRAVRVRDTEGAKGEKQ